MTAGDVADSDPLDAVLDLEESFYADGQRIGKSDGEQAGRSEGRAFGIEKGFEKFLEMGKLHGQAIVWAGRLSDEDVKGDRCPEESRTDDVPACSIPLPQSAKSVSHVQTFYALTEIDSISTENDEAAIADFDDRLKRAKGKARVIEKLVGESKHSASDGIKSRAQQNDGSIEDVSVLRVRH